MVSSDQSAGNVFEDPLYMMSYFCHFFFQLPLFVFIFQQFDYGMSRCGYLSLSCLEFDKLLGCIDHFSSEFGIFVHYFFKYYFRPFLTLLSFCGFCYAYIRVLCVFPQVSEIQFIFFILLSVLQTEKSQLIYLQVYLVLSFATSNLWLSPSS